MSPRRIHGGPMQWRSRGAPHGSAPERKQPGAAARDWSRTSRRKASLPPPPLGQDPDAARGHWQLVATQGEPQAQRGTASRREPLGGSPSA
eukprot:8400234-Alexandrium_andersonii.AAC.1